MNDNEHRHRCFSELAPLYVLDLLEIEDRLWVEAQVVDCPDLAEELANYEAAVGLVPYGATPVPMAADLKDRLFARLAVRDSDRLGLEPVTEPVTELSPAREMYTVRSQDLEWKPHRVKGVQCAILSVDEKQRMRSMVVKVAAGVVYPIHRHGGIEEIYMLEGDLIIDDETYFAGDYIRSFSGSIHAPSSVTGCMFVIRACMDDEYF
jgi:anti-sigma factor ChrR (cupin superfamily)